MTPWWNLSKPPSTWRIHLHGDKEITGSISLDVVTLLIEEEEEAEEEVEEEENG